MLLLLHFFKQIYMNHLDWTLMEPDQNYRPKLPFFIKILGRSGLFTDRSVHQPSLVGSNYQACKEPSKNVHGSHTNFKFLHNTASHKNYFQMKTYCPGSTASTWHVSQGYFFLASCLDTAGNAFDGLLVQLGFKNTLFGKPGHTWSCLVTENGDTLLSIPSLNLALKLVDKLNNTVYIKIKP